VPLALLPAGTANILAKELGIPWDIPAAAHLIADGVERRVALGMATPLPVPGQAHSDQVRRYFLCVAGAGPDGAIVQMIGEAAKTRAGILAYWWEGLRQLFQYRFPEMRVAGGGTDMRATLVVIGRTVNYGGPFKITTGASLFEDSFEVLVHTSRSRWRYLICLPALWTGQLRKMDCITAWKTTEVTCWPAKSVDVYAQLDGEAAGVLPIQFRIVPDALTLIVPKALRT
jgi:diacylglycerol kinase family enzyme